MFFFVFFVFRSCSLFFLFYFRSCSSFLLAGFFLRTLKHEIVILYVEVKNMGASGADSTRRTSGFQWAELTCARWAALNNCLQLALTSLLLDKAGSQPRSVVRNAYISSKVEGTLGTTLASSSTSLGSGSD